MFSFFRKKKVDEPVTLLSRDFSFLGCDMHSHLVPAIDDGSQSLEDSFAFIKTLHEQGIRKFITTPHIHGEIYDNDNRKVREYFEPLKAHVEQYLPDVSIEVSAEYFMDNHFLNEVLPGGLMAFGDNYVLVEVSMAGWPRNFDELIFKVQAAGYKPILAHPERYIYETDMSFYEQLRSRGVLLQMNLLSVTGYYGKVVKDNAFAMMERNLYQFCGTDLHHERHLARILKIPEVQPATMNKLVEYGFENPRLCS